MLSSVLLTLVGVAIAISAWNIGFRVLEKRQKAVIFQFGEFTNTREGLKNHPYWENEPDVVEFTDYKYWIRLYPNRGFNLPVIGYYSQARGRRR